MNAPVSLRFESRLVAPPERVWAWITSIEGISAEMWPYLRMTIPGGVRSLADVHPEPGAPLFRSWVLLFGVLPIDYSDLTLLELDPGRGFLEQSPMGSMTLWRHERRIVPDSESGVVTLVDQLTFRPRLAKGLVRWFIRRVFTHRHRVLRANLGGAHLG